MRLTIELPEEVGEQVLALPDPEVFVARAVAQALKGRPAKRGLVGRSRWADLVERVERSPAQLGKYYPRFKDDLQEFRDSFDFRRQDAE